jgi:hypothetical protein
MSQAEAIQLYKQGDYAAAAASFTQVLNQTQDAATRSIILSNRAACALAMQDPAAAGADCRAGLVLNPLSPKLRLRLAKALTQQQQYSAAAAEVAAVVALEKPKEPSSELLQLYQQVTAATGVSDGSPAAADTSIDSSSAGVQLPAHPQNILYVSSAQQLMYANSRQVPFIVLAPGAYVLTQPLDGGYRPSGGCTIVGLGQVSITCRNTHAVWVCSGDLTLVNVQLAGSGDGAAVCVSPANPAGIMAGLPSMLGNASCKMIDCRVEQYPEAGLLVCGSGAHAALHGCSFKRCKQHAIEVREGGSLYACNTVMDSCKQGVAAYGGAKSVQLYSCSIRSTRKEGILAAGSYVNAATAAQRQVRDPRISPFRSATSQRATEEAEAWGRQHGQQLTLVMSDCSLQGCGNFGVSVDEGAAARISRCRMEACDPCCVFIKGRSDACITACQFVYGGKSSKSIWAQGQALTAAGELTE